jgi:DNA-binding NtrC family response regulator
MVVDDEPDVARIVAHMLQSAGFKVDYFTNPEDAFKHFSENLSLYSAVLTDIRMPAINGIELVNAIHEIKPDGIILMLMTAFDNDMYDLPEFIKPEDILRKPFQAETVCDAVKRELKIVV